MALEVARCSRLLVMTGPFSPLAYTSSFGEILDLRTRAYGLRTHAPQQDPFTDCKPAFRRFSRRVDYFGLVIVPPLQNPAKLGGVWHEALREERQDLVACLDGRLAGRVDQVGRHDAVRARNALREEGRHIGVCRAVGEHAPDEAVAERRRIGGEALGAAEPIPAKR